MLDPMRARSPARVAVSDVGLGWRPEIGPDLLARPSLVDFVEVVAETCQDERTRREAVALAEIWPVIPHGVKLSLGSAEGIDRDRAARLGKLARELRAPRVSEHIAFVRAGGREIGHLTELPLTRAAVRVVAKNVETLRRELPDVPLLLENVARAFVWPSIEDEMTEGEFCCEIVEATGCDLLLDVSNLYANARNAGRDPAAWLETFPLERVGMVHLAGGIERDGFYFDTHAHPIDDAIFALLARAPSAPVLIERDAHFPRGAIDSLANEIERVRALPRMCISHASTKRETAWTVLGPDETASLASAQRDLARTLTDNGDPFPRFSGDAVRRARAVLLRKRVEDALPLLPTLARDAGDAHDRFMRCMAQSLRVARLNAAADAFRIADAMADDPKLAAAARTDRLGLRARFSGAVDALRERHAPFVGREVLSPHATLWAVKGPGKRARLRVIHQNGNGRHVTGRRENGTNAE